MLFWWLSSIYVTDAQYKFYLTEDFQGMIFESKLIAATLIKRYKRFLADVRLADGSTLTVHCPNTGTMKTCSSPESPVMLSTSDNPKRKYPHTLEMIYENNVWIGVNTGLTNKLVAEAITNGDIEEFKDVLAIKREVTVSKGSRLDLLVEQEDQKTYIEIKNCSMAIDRCAMFPDAVTARGTKHLEELIKLKQKGNGAAIFFLIQRGDTDYFTPARQIDPCYSDTLAKAKKAGVILLAYQADVSPEGISVKKALPIKL